MYDSKTKTFSIPHVFVGLCFLRVILQKENCVLFKSGGKTVIAIKTHGWLIFGAKITCY